MSTYQEKKITSWPVIYFKIKTGPIIGLTYKMEPVNNEVNTVNVKLNKTLIPSSIIGGKKTYIRLSTSFLSQKKKIK